MLTYEDLINNLERGSFYPKGQPRVLVIGAGISGIACWIALKKIGLKCIVLEQNKNCGGVWSSGGHFAAYHGLIQNTSTSNMMLDDDTKPSAGNGHHFTLEEYANYVDAIIQKYSLKNEVYLNARVCTIAASETHNYKYQIAVSSASLGSSTVSLEFDHVVFAGGGLHTPAIPTICGIDTFMGQTLHSSEAQDTLRFKDQNVLLVGFGNTAGDLAVQLSHKAKSVTISSRNPTWVLPRSIDNIPLDEIVRKLWKTNSRDFERQLHSLCLENGGRFYAFDSGTVDSVDFRNTRILTNENLPAHVDDKSVTILPEVRLIDQNTIHFINNSAKNFDTIIYCTGYRASFPIFNHKYSDTPLVGSVLHPSCRGFWFLGLTPIWGSAPAVAKLQARLVAHCIQKNLSTEELRSFEESAPNYERANVVFPLGLVLPEYNSFARHIEAVIFCVTSGDSE
jgi:dimethylaniline monooxygenase (N-oxide forming)